MTSWTDERVSLLKTMKAQGLSHSKIAAAVSLLPGEKVTRNAVGAKIDRLGLTDKAASYSSSASRGDRSRPKLKVVREQKPLAPIERGDNSVRLVDRNRNQCPFPVEGEGADTIACGEPIAFKGFCQRCAERMYDFRAKGKAA